MFRILILTCLISSLALQAANAQKKNPAAAKPQKVVTAKKTIPEGYPKNSREQLKWLVKYCSYGKLNIMNLNKLREILEKLQQKSEKDVKVYEGSSDRKAERLLLFSQEMVEWYKKQIVIVNAMRDAEIKLLSVEARKGEKIEAYRKTVEEKIKEMALDFRKVRAAKPRPPRK